MSKYKQGNSALYGFGMIGSLVYFVTKGGGAVAIIFGVLKSFVWPAFLVYEMWKYLGA